MLVLKCPKHPRYTGQQSPRCACYPCQTLHELRLRAALNHVTVVTKSKPSEAPSE